MAVIEDNKDSDLVFFLRRFDQKNFQPVLPLHVKILILLLIADENRWTFGVSVPAGSNLAHQRSKFPPCLIPPARSVGSYPSRERDKKPQRRKYRRIRPAGSDPTDPAGGIGPGGNANVGSRSQVKICWETMQSDECFIFHGFSCGLVNNTNE